MRTLDLSIGQRLSIGFALLLAVFVGLIATMYYWNTLSTAAQDTYTERITPLTQAASELERAILRVAISTRGYLITPESERLQRHERTLDNARAALRRLDQLPKQADSEMLYRPLPSLVERYLTEASLLVRAHTSTRAADSTGESALALTREAVLGALQNFSDVQQEQAEVALEAIGRTRAQTTNGLVIAALSALLIFAVAALLTAQSIRRPTRELLGVAGALQQGDWRPALAWTPRPSRATAVRDELLRLGQAFGAAAAALEKREQRLRADRVIASATASSLSKEEVAGAALHAACDHVRAEVGAAYWFDEATEKLAPIALRALDGSVPAAAVGDGIPGRAAKEMRAVVIRDIPPDSPFSVKLGYDAAPPRAVAAVPIVFRGTLLGVLLVASLRDLDAADLAFLEDAARQLAVGLQNVKTYERVQHLLADLAAKSKQIQAQNEELQAQNEELQAQQEEIQAQNEELQAQGEEIRAQNDQLTQQADELRAHAGSLAEADRRKSEFLGVLAHELRNPMAAISNSLYALANAGDNKQLSRAQQVIDRQTRLLSRLVDDLLDVTRISNGKLVLQNEAVDFGEIVNECAEDYRDAAQRSGTTLEIEISAEPPWVEGDRTRLCQIVGNLLDNAIKFGNGGRHVKVSLQAQGQDAVLRVQDRGIGMDAVMISRLFQPFSQADSSLARRRSGLGLGLALAKALVDLHHGSIEAHSSGLGRGSEFIVRLPLLVRATPFSQRSERQPLSPLSQTGKGRRVLIIEDNVDSALSLQYAMELAGHQVRVAYDADEGIALAREFQPEVLLCDIGLPTMDGYQVARTFRSDERLRSTYMIAVTGYAAAEDRDRAASAGFDRHLRKPPDIELLIKLLEDLKSADSK